MIPGYDDAAVDIDDDDGAVVMVAGGDEAIAIDEDAGAVVMVVGGVEEAKSGGPSESVPRSTALCRGSFAEQAKSSASYRSD